MMFNLEFVAITIVAMIIFMFMGLSLHFQHKGRIRKLSNNQQALADDKSKAIINYSKNIKELCVASQKCYIIKNAVKCIDVVTLCPSLVNVQSGTDRLTPFHRVCSNGHSTLAKFMLLKGANPQITTPDNQTALCLALRACINDPTASLDCLNVLLEDERSRLDFTNKWYRTYFDAAVMGHHKALVQWFFDQQSSDPVLDPIHRQLSCPSSI